eukprot:TRINITY_DN5383_c0_g1_i1.p1 TRINITY_DN5383_c0_g1~~TRINITY_DN5383_c0_g1_i1.p1  ORF type:complete len:107 (-),score=27.09 TRINITY_DN5383_c0_g1_i1:8-328(-)
MRVNSTLTDIKFSIFYEIQFKKNPNFVLLKNLVADNKKYQRALHRLAHWPTSHFEWPVDKRSETELLLLLFKSYHLPKDILVYLFMYIKSHHYTTALVQKKHKGND